MPRGHGSPIVPSHSLVRPYYACKSRIRYVFFSLSFWLRSRSPLAHFELLYIYNRQIGRLHIPKGDLDQYGQIFIPNDCTFGLFRLLGHREANCEAYWP
eukprot:COSAG05_NODE_907_length_6645_cov_18.681638_1_plen_99_part_00